MGVCAPKSGHYRVVYGVIISSQVVLYRLFISNVRYISTLGEEEKCLSKSETGHIKSNPSEETVFTTTTQEGRRKSAAWPVSSSRGYTQPQKCFVYTHSTYPSIHPSVNEELLYEPLRMDARASSAPFFQVK
jgi:hypothetical protein